MRIVLDTNILVRAAQRPGGPARAVLRQVRAGSHTLISSPFIRAETERVLNYPRLQALWPVKLEDIQDFLRELQAHPQTQVVALPVDPTDTISSDPNDEPIIQTAVTGQADVLCTLDRHLRSRRVRAYCTKHGIRILTDVELLGELRTAK